MGNQLTSSAVQSYQWYSVQTRIDSSHTKYIHSFFRRRLLCSGRPTIRMRCHFNYRQSKAVRLRILISMDCRGCDTSCVSVSDLSGQSDTMVVVLSGAVNALQSGSSPDPFCFVEPGNYPVTLIVNNGAGSDTLEQTLAVTMLPSPGSIVYISWFTFVPENVHHSAIWRRGTISSFVMVLFRRITRDRYNCNSIEHLLCIFRNFPVTLTVNNGTCMKPVPLWITSRFNLPLFHVVSQVGNTLTSTPAVTYQWFNVQSGIIAGADSSSYTVLSSGDYYVQVTDANGCTAESSPLHVDVSELKICFSALRYFSKSICEYNQHSQNEDW